MDAMTQLLVYESRAGRMPTTEQGVKALWEKPPLSHCPSVGWHFLKKKRKTHGGNHTMCLSRNKIEEGVRPVVSRKRRFLG